MHEARLVSAASDRSLGFQRRSSQGVGHCRVPLRHDSVYGLLTVRHSDTFYASSRRVGHWTPCSTEGVFSMLCGGCDLADA